MLPLLRLTPPMEGFPGMISVKFCTEVGGWPGYTAGTRTAVKKYRRKVQPPE